MSDYNPDDFGDLSDFEPPDIPPGFVYSDRVELGGGSVILDIYTDPEREASFSAEDAALLDALINLPEFINDAFIDSHNVDPQDVNPGESWTTGPFESPEEAWRWAQEMGVAGFSDWYETDDGDIYVVISKESE